MQASYLTRLTLRQIDVFLAVCQHRSYSKAAEQLSLTQPAVSSQIRNLEELVGQAIFDYLGKQLYLTPAGEVLLRAARDFKQRLVHLEIELTDLHGRLQGKLNVAMESAADTLLPQLINRFCARHPDVEVQLQVSNHQQLMERLQDNLDDLVIMTQVPASRALVYTPFAEHQLCLVADPQHPLAGREDIKLLDILRTPLLMRELGSGTSSAFEAFCREQACVIEQCRQIASNAAIFHALPGSGASAVLPVKLVAEAVDQGRLITLSVSGFPIRHSWCSVYQRGKHLNPLATAFLDSLHHSN